MWHFGDPEWWRRNSPFSTLPTAHPTLLTTGCSQQCCWYCSSLTSQVIPWEHFPLSCSGQRHSVPSTKGEGTPSTKPSSTPKADSRPSSTPGALGTRAGSFAGQGCSPRARGWIKAGEAARGESSLSTLAQPEPAQKSSENLCKNKTKGLKTPPEDPHPPAPSSSNKYRCGLRLAPARPRCRPRGVAAQLSVLRRWRRLSAGGEAEDVCLGWLLLHPAGYHPAVRVSAAGCFCHGRYSAAGGGKRR